jgi:RNA polymerase sigma-70 factor (ECF subfamily)
VFKKGDSMTSQYEFSDVYNEYYATVLRYVARIVGKNDAEDVAQDVFDKVNRNLGGFQGKSKLSTWIYRIATNTAIDRTRSAAYKHAPKHIAIECDADRGPESVLEDHKPPSTDQLVIQKEMSECIKEHIETLPPDYKTVIVLSELEGLANKEIAEILDISIENVKVRLHRARAKLKVVLDEACDFYHTGQNTLACDRKQVQILPKPPKQ